MHTQKVIAKWLAIIVLVTLIVACYILLSRLPKTSPQSDAINIAGADTTEPLPQPPQKDPYYSVLPRSSEQIGNMQIAHIGGEADDIFVDVFAFDNRRIVIFQSLSCQYDVKSSGVYVAVFEGGLLTHISKLSESATYICGTLTQNGIILITRTKTQSTLSLIDSYASLIARTNFPLYDSYRLHTLNRTLTLFCADAEAIYAYTVSNDVSLQKSAYIHQYSNCILKQALPLAGMSLLIAENQQGVKILSFDNNKGFKLAHTLINSTFCQMLPCLINDTFSIIISTLSNEGLQINSFDSQLNHLNSTHVDEVFYGILFCKNNVLTLNCYDKSLLFCQHLDNIGKLELTHDNILASQLITLEALPAAPSFFLIHTEDGFYLCHADSNSNTTLKYIKGKSDIVSALSNEENVELYFSANADNDFSYMAFGARDAFVLSILT